MPEFNLNYGTREARRTFVENLDEFTQGYIEATFFTETGTGDDGDLEHATISELAPITIATIIADCAAWQEANAALLQEAYTHNYTPVRAGRDYWYTRNGHGTGFWDRDLDKAGERLTDACKYQTVDMYRSDDGLIYFT